MFYWLKQLSEFAVVVRRFSGVKQVCSLWHDQNNPSEPTLSLPGKGCIYLNWIQK